MVQFSCQISLAEDLQRKIQPPTENRVSDLTVNTFPLIQS